MTADEERAAIVGYLEAWIDQTMGQDISPQYLIDAIERLAHHERNGHEGE